MVTGLAQQFGIEGFPTIKVFGKGKKNPKKFEDYQGAREAGPITEWISRKVPLRIEQIVSQSLFDSACGSKQMCLISFLPHILDDMAAGRKIKYKLMKAVAKDYRGKIDFVWIEGGAQPDLEASFNVRSQAIQKSTIALSVLRLIACICSSDSVSLPRC